MCVCVCFTITTCGLCFAGQSSDSPCLAKVQLEEEFIHLVMILESGVSVLTGILTLDLRWTYVLSCELQENAHWIKK